MKKELIITVIIVITIFVASFFAQNYINISISDMNNNLENLKNSVINESKDSNELSDQIDEIYNKWEDRYKILTCYVEHSELEKVNTELKLIKGFIEVEEEKQSVSEIENCLYLLKHLKDKQVLNLKNIF